MKTKISQLKQSRNFIQWFANLSELNSLDLFMLRCWNLFDSISNSITVFPFLELWKDSGKLKLRQLIANVGISLEDSKQGYQFLNPDHKKNLLKKYCEASIKMSFPQITCDSFVYYLDHKNSLDAFDMTHTINSVLNSEKNLKDTVLRLESEIDDSNKSPQVNNELNFWSTFQQILD